MTMSICNTVIYDDKWVCVIQVFCTTWVPLWIRSYTASSHTAIVERFMTPSVRRDHLRTRPDVAVFAAVMTVETAAYTAATWPSTGIMGRQCLACPLILCVVSRLISARSDSLPATWGLAMSKTVPCSKHSRSQGGNREGRGNRPQEFKIAPTFCIFRPELRRGELTAALPFRHQECPKINSWLRLWLYTTV